MEYHAITYGWILGEVARRADGRTFAQLLHDLIRQPLGIEDMYVGIPDDVEARVAVLAEPEAEPIGPNETGHYAIPPLVQPLFAWMNQPAARRTCNPASCGIMSARAVARHYAALLPGGVDGVELLPPAHVRAVTRLKEEKDCTAAELAVRRALGYGNGGPDSIYGSRATAFGHGGYGGSAGFADPEYGFACGLTKNLFSKRGAGSEIVSAIRRGLGIAD